MSEQLVTMSTGTTIRLTDNDYVILDNPAAPPDMRHCEAGRMIDGGFQPAPFAPWALRPEALRAIADLIDPRPDAPVTAGATVTEWGVRCSAVSAEDAYVSEAVDRAHAEQVKRHHDAADQGCEHWIVSRQVTPWAVDGPSEGGGDRG